LARNGRQAASFMIPSAVTCILPVRARFAWGVPDVISAILAVAHRRSAKKSARAQKPDRQVEIRQLELASRHAGEPVGGRGMCFDFDRNRDSSRIRHSLAPKYLAPMPPSVAAGTKDWDRVFERVNAFARATRRLPSL
jgi:hypothetical protein